MAKDNNPLLNVFMQKLKDKGVDLKGGERHSDILEKMIEEKKKTDVRPKQAAHGDHTSFGRHRSHVGEPCKDEKPTPDSKLNR